MRKVLFFAIIFFISFGIYAQELEADDFVIINQTDAAYPGFNAKTYRGLFPVGHGQFKMFNYGGIPGNLTALGSNETLGSFVFNGYDGSSNVISAVIQAKTITDSRDPRFNFLLSNGVGNQRPNRMTIIGQTGNVGIGITDPTEKLDVNGNIRMRQGATLGYILVSDADGKMTWTDPSTISTADDMDWLTDIDGELYRTDGVYMGEGIDSPDGHRLNVQNNTSGKAAVRGINQTPSGLTLFCEGQLALQNYATNPAGLPFDVNNIGVFGKVYPIGENGAAIYGWNNGIQTDNYSGLFISDGAATSGTNYGLYASAQNALNNWAGYFAQGDVHINDNVRIGTTSASDYKLLLDAGNETTAIRATGNHIYGTWFTLQNESTGGVPWNIISSGQLSGEGVGKLLFHTDYADPGTSATKMVLEREGNLGIGTFDPTEKLDVDGNIRMRTGAMAGYIPVADADGVMNWTAPSSIFTPSPWITSGSDLYYDTGNIRIGAANTSPYKLSVDAGNEIEVMKASGANVFGSYFTLQNESAGGVPWNLISTGQFNGEGAGKLLFHTNAATGTWAAKMTLETGGHVGIGVFDPISQLHIVDDTLTLSNNAIRAESSRNSNTTSTIQAAYTPTEAHDGRAISAFAGAIEAYGYGVHSTAGFVGVASYATGGAYSGTESILGIYSSSSGTAGVRKGVYGTANNTAGDAYGGEFVGAAGGSGKTAYGVIGYGDHSEEGLSYGVFANHDGADTGYSLYINGQGFATSGGVLASDERFKKDIKEVKGALDIIKELQPKTYNFRQDGEFAKLNFDDKLQYGFIAQELEEVLPNAVHDVDVVFTDPERQAALSNPENKGKGLENNTYTKEYKGVNYTALIPVLTQGIKELSATVEEKEEVIEKMETKMDAITKQMDEMAAMLENMNDKFSQMEEDMSSCCLNDTDAKTGSINTNLELNGSDVPSLEQNNPNPFYEQTVIKYYISSAAKNARMTIVDMKGSPIKSVNLAGTGLGTVTINANELPVGTYVYTLFVDGKQVESKQMILVK
jgi:uncharacterized coiled-coil protein SlyX